MSRNGTPMQRLRDKQRASPAPERIAYLRERGLEQAVETVEVVAETALGDAAGAQEDADQALIDAATADAKAVQAAEAAEHIVDGTTPLETLVVDGIVYDSFLTRTDGAAIDDPAAIPDAAVQSQARSAISVTGPHLGYSSGVVSLLAGSANGVATLDGSAKIPTSQLPALAITDVFVVNTQAAQLALTAEEGDVAVRSDLNKSYIHNGGAAGTMSDWQELLTPTDAVLSVNGFSGAVNLTTANVSEGGGVLYFTNGRADARVAAAVGVTVQAYDADLAAFAGKTAPSGAVVGTSDTQTLSGKTFSGVTNLPNGLLDSFGNLTLGSTNAPAYSSILRLDGPMEMWGSQVNFVPGASTAVEFVNRSGSGGFDFYVNGGTLGVQFLSSGTLRLNNTLTAGAVAQTHHIPININGTLYKLLLAS